MALPAREQDSREKGEFLKTLTILACVLALMLPLAAQNPPGPHNPIRQIRPESVINVTVPGLNCTAAGTNMFQAQAWSWGGSASSGDLGTGAGAGRATLSNLIIEKSLDGCSPALFGAMVTGKHFNSLSLVQQDLEGNILLTINLSEVIVTSWQISGSSGSARPTEQVGLAFAKVCVQEPSSGSKFCYDLATNRTF